MAGRAETAGALTAATNSGLLPGYMGPLMTGTAHPASSRKRCVAAETALLRGLDPNRAALVARRSGVVATRLIWSELVPARSARSVGTNLACLRRCVASVL